MSDGPAPTQEGHDWRCSSCTWRGATLVAAKSHLLEGRERAFPHHPFEAPVGAEGGMAQVATRIMLPHGEGGRVTVKTYSAARRALYARLDPLVASLRARRGRLKAGR